MKNRESDTNERKAVAVDAEAKKRNLARLKRIEGQVRGLQKMVEDDRYCPDILTQIASVHEALRGVGRELDAPSPSTLRGDGNPCREEGSGGHVRRTGGDDVPECAIAAIPAAALRSRYECWSASARS